MAKDQRRQRRWHQRREMVLIVGLYVVHTNMYNTCWYHKRLSQSAFSLCRTLFALYVSYVNRYPLVNFARLIDGQTQARRTNIRMQCILGSWLGLLHWAFCWHRSEDHHHSCCAAKRKTEDFYHFLSSFVIGCKTISKCNAVNQC